MIKLLSDNILLTTGAKRYVIIRADMKTWENAFEKQIHR